MRFIVPKKGLEEKPLRGSDPVWPPGHYDDTKIASTFFHRPAGPDDPTKFYNPL